jgi:hypothetical protein
MLWVIGGVAFAWMEIHDATRFDVQSIVPIAALLLGLGIMWTREGFR